MEKPTHRMFVAALAVATLSIPLPIAASTLVPQTPLDARCIPRFVTPLPIFGPGPNAALPRVDTSAHPSLQITMRETEQQVLPQIPPSADCPVASPMPPTRVWTYETRDLATGTLLGPAHWPGVTLENRRFHPTTVKYVNELPALGESFVLAGQRTTGLVQGLVSVDQTLDWAAPDLQCLGKTNPPCMRPYVGPPPATPHLHGAEVPSAFDGGPESWFTPRGRHGPTYATLRPTDRNAAIYRYPNAQEPGTPWFHDHAFGATRTNVYSGLAAFYFLRDPATEPVDLPSGAYEIELALQDRQFDTNGQLFFADGSGAAASNLNGTPPNPGVHPLWIPEFVGDVAVVNGVPWPFLVVEPRRYRFRIVGGANARMWNLDLGAPAWVIGTDDGYLDAPARIEANSVPLPDVNEPFVQRLFIAPGERYDIIVDFSSLEGETITVTNDAPVPFPSGLVPGTDQPTMAEVLQFRVTAPLQGTDTSCDPASGGCGRRAAARVVRLASEGNTTPAVGVTIDRRRQLVLKEVEGPGGPLEVLVNNTKFDGRASPGIASEFRATDGVSELPRVGSTELWEVVNLTADAHPMHTHLVQFQILSRQPFDFDRYLHEWAAAFPPSCKPQAEVGCPGYGPPRPYGVPNTDGAVGGNPALSPFLLGEPRPANPEEAGWKDTAKSHHAEVLRMLVRFAPTSAAVAGAQPGRNLFPFDPTAGPGYVWHCHIVDHEDNEMMRPYRVAR